MFGILMVIIGLIILTVLAIKGVPILFATAIASIFVLATQGVNVVEGITQSYMTGFSTYFMNYFLIFTLGAIFGKLAEVSGATDSIAKTIVDKLGEKYVGLGIFIAAAVLGYGGVNLFVALFALYPLGKSMFKRADVPRRLFPMCYLAGCGTFAMTGPFSPSTQNIIPTSYLGTTLAAGLVPGLVGSVFCAVLCAIYIQWRINKCKKNGEHYVLLPGEESLADDDNRDVPNFLISLLPLILLIIILNVTGWPIVVSLFVGVILGIIIYWKWMPHSFSAFWKDMSSGATNGLSSIANTAATVGFGAVVQATPAFATLSAALTGMAQNGNAYIAVAIAVAALAGISGSASGGLGIAVPMCADLFIPMGVSAEAIHRIAAVSSSALDSLPHNGFVNTCLQYCETNHKESYFDSFVVTVIITTAELALVVALFSIMG